MAVAYDFFGKRVIQRAKAPHGHLACGDMERSGFRPDGLRRLIGIEEAKAASHERVLLRTHRAAALSGWTCWKPGGIMPKPCPRCPAGGQHTRIRLGDPMRPVFPPGASSAPRVWRERGHDRARSGAGDN